MEGGRRLPARRRVGERILKAADRRDLPLSPRLRQGATRERYGDLAPLDNTGELMFGLQRAAEQDLDVKPKEKRGRKEVERACVARG
ncbi:hypothetical protein EYF80_016049 [Liparis tanakae]|uniref:Uncharacterized protein n=1 Tax=Liparis tanakae TaxID=230148 RepID=A0A4Z2I6I4_9TELE|nr:hypothetical protein EYF80_016049 [Liparis tanakae]